MSESTIIKLKAFFAELGKDSPVIGVGAAKFAGLTMNDWLIVLAMLYGALRLFSIGLDVYWKIKDRRNGKSQ